MSFASEPEKLRRFINLIRDNQGYPLYQAVSAAKEQLSDQRSTSFSLAAFGVEDR